MEGRDGPRPRGAEAITYRPVDVDRHSRVGQPERQWSCMRWPRMSKESLQKQADRAENIADQTVDDQLKETLREAAREYREKAEREAESQA